MPRAEEIVYVNTMPRAATPAAIANASPAPAVVTPSGGVAEALEPMFVRVGERAVDLLQLLARCGAVVAVLAVFSRPYIDVFARYLAPTASEWAHGVGVKLTVPMLTDPLGRDSMTVVIRSMPDGGTVKVDGRERGVTPAVLELECKERRLHLTVQKPGFEPWAQDAPCYPGTEIRIDAALATESSRPR